MIRAIAYSLVYFIIRWGSRRTGYIAKSSGRFNFENWFYEFPLVLLGRYSRIIIYDVCPSASPTLRTQEVHILRRLMFLLMIAWRHIALLGCTMIIYYYFQEFCTRVQRYVRIP